jgi:hypothetical protein
MRSIFCSLLLLVVTCAAGSVAAQDNAPKLDRAQSVINAFQAICTLEPLNFDRVDQKATLMNMPVQANKSGPSDSNGTIRQKMWTGGLTDGPFLLMLDELSDARGRTTACAVVADVPDREAFRSEVIRTMQLPEPRAPELGNDGSRSYVWDNAMGKDTIVIERDFIPSGKPGVMLKLIAKTQAGQ